MLRLAHFGALLFILGLASICLGGLWLLQGLGVVKLSPILCVADCASIEAPSMEWTFFGVAMIAVGMWLTLRSTRRSAHRRDE